LSAAHADESPRVKGSALRRENEKQAKSVEGYWVPANPTPPLLARMRAKDAAARTFDWDSELWLLITTQHPDPGAIAATLLVRAVCSRVTSQQHIRRFPPAHCVRHGLRLPAI